MINRWPSILVLVLVLLVQGSPALPSSPPHPSLKEDEPVVTFLTKLGPTVPAFVITSVDQKQSMYMTSLLFHNSYLSSSSLCRPEDAAMAHADPREARLPVLVSSVKESTSAYENKDNGDIGFESSNHEDVLQVEPEEEMTFRSAFKALSEMYPDTNSTRTTFNETSEVLDTNPSQRIFTSYASPRRNQRRRQRNRSRHHHQGVSHYVPSDVFTIESAAKYPPRSFHSNAIFYQKALSFLREYKSALIRNRPNGLSYRPNSGSDDPSHIQAAYEEMTPVIIKTGYEFPLVPHNDPRNQGSKSRTAINHAGHQQSAPATHPHNQQQEYSSASGLQHPASHLPITDVVPIIRAGDKREIVGYLPVLSVPRPAETNVLRDSVYQAPTQAFPLVPPTTPATVQERDQAVKGGARDSQAANGKTGRRKNRKGQRSRYLSPSLMSRRRRKNNNNRQRNNNNNYNNNYNNSQRSAKKQYPTTSSPPHNAMRTTTYSPPASPSNPTTGGRRPYYDQILPRPAPFFGHEVHFPNPGFRPHYPLASGSVPSLSPLSPLLPSSSSLQTTTSHKKRGLLPLLKLSFKSAVGV